jgi:hypothetical protein
MMKQMKFKRNTVFGLDFDGTCVTHAYPDIGKPIGSIHVLKRIVEASGRLVLNTMRSGEKLQEAVEWFKENDIPLFGIQRNPEQDKWTSSPKAYAQIYIDDAALGCPLTENVWLSNRPFVDWKKVEDMLFISDNGYADYVEAVKEAIHAKINSFRSEPNTEERRVKLSHALYTMVKEINESFDLPEDGPGYYFSAKEVGIIPLKKENDSASLTFNDYTKDILNL